MKKRKIYYRKKGKSIIIEGKKKGKSIFILTLPNPEKLLDALFRRIDPYTISPLSKQKEASFLTIEKATKIREKVKRLDYKQEKGAKS